MATVVFRAEALQDTFNGFRGELDEHNDRRERLIKVSRDVTSASKRMIFLLHRFPHASFGASAEGQQSPAAIKLISEATEKQQEIVDMVTGVALREGLMETDRRNEQDGDAATKIGRAIRYDRAFGPGMEEFIEAASFFHFLRYGSIISLAEIQALFADPQSGRVVLRITPQRYLLGLSDLSGELMRFATNALGAGGAQDVVTFVLATLRALANGLDPFVPLIREFRKKQQVTMQSTRKIEDLSYAVKVRSAEYGSDQSALQEMVRRALTGGNNNAAVDDGDTDD